MNAGNEHNQMFGSGYGFNGNQNSFDGMGWSDQSSFNPMMQMQMQMQNGMQSGTWNDYSNMMGTS